MAKYLYRSCPECGDYLGIVIPQLPQPVKEISIDATCLRCGYRLPFRKIVLGKPVHSTLATAIVSIRNPS